jgi:hypothetical protein
MTRRTLARSLGTLALALAGATVRSQEPAGPPPPSSTRDEAGADVHELLPDLGRIGSEVGLLGGGSWNPYETGAGFQLGGFIDLPLLRAPGGKLSYEMLVSMSQATSDPFTITDPVAYVANLAAGAPPEAALAGPPQAPFPVRRDVRTRLRLLQVSPFGLRYTLLGLGHGRLRPYFGAGLDFLVVITRQEPERDESLQLTGTSPFDDPLIGGLVAQAPELTARGIPTGQGDFELGGHAQAGVEIRVSGALSLNLDYRFTTVGGSHELHSLSGALGFHW